jgi:hypothetical protein
MFSDVLKHVVCIHNLFTAEITSVMFLEFFLLAFYTCSLDDPSYCYDASYQLIRGARRWRSKHTMSGSRQFFPPTSKQNQVSASHLLHIPLQSVNLIPVTCLTNFNPSILSSDPAKPRRQAQLNFKKPADITLEVPSAAN